MAADVLAPGFWEVGSYKHNVKRFKDGVEQLDDYCKMSRERAEIEAKYSKMLSQHAEKWRAHVDRTVSAGSVKTVWNELIGEATALSRVHNSLKDCLIDDIVNETTTYRKNSLHTSVFKGPKEIREIEDHFEKAQKPWKKLVDKMEDKRGKYYNVCRQEKSALVNLQNCQTDTSVSPDAATKFRERHEKLKEEVQRTKVDYQKTLTNLNEYKNVYMEAMAHVFKMCQEKEMDRSQFLIGIVQKTQRHYANIIRNSQMSGLHQQLEQSIRSADSEAVKRDLAQWSSVNGVDAFSEWPSFVEYSPEIRNIAARGGSTKDAGGVILTRQINRSEDIPSTHSNTLPSVAVNTASSHEDVGKSSPKSSSESDTSTFDSRKHNSTANKYKNQPQNTTQIQPPPVGWHPSDGPDSPPLSTETPDSAKYGDFEEFTTSKPAVVLYDYAPAEGDEIALRKGEMIEVLTEPDSLGWCTGRVSGNVGLFPASYVQCQGEKS
ncbi:SH3 domain-containing protein [Caenorhabditis elegans]|nr:SH3 domain-containing protein [Caenorhabditis elegans]CCD66642.1 SH3 domain-containing protein [Caenorhabditis elegans]|eukprot:NP_001024664.1 SynDaPiN (synaptic dynamin binding protein) homolog [Caenorhabditis elegans]